MSVECNGLKSDVDGSIKALDGTPLSQISKIPNRNMGPKLGHSIMIRTAGFNKRSKFSGVKKSGVGGFQVNNAPVKQSRPTTRFSMT